MPFKNIENVKLQQTESLGEYAKIGKIITYKPILFSILIMRHCFKFLLLLPFIFFYLLLGVCNAKKEKTAIPLLIMNGLSMSLLIILFFFSMAGMLRLCIHNRLHLHYSKTRGSIIVNYNVLIRN